MRTWTNKQWGALIGAALVILVAVLGLGTAALVVVFAIVGYFIGSYLDSDFDLDDVRARVQRGPQARGTAQTRQPYERV